MDHPPRPRPSWPELAALAAPLAIAVAGYAGALDGQFQFDDLGGITDHPANRGFWAWIREAPFPETLLTGRPLTTLTFAANYAVGRLDPLGYHLVNLAIHLVVVVLAGALALRVAALAGAERPRRLALGVAGLFAVHPLQTQAVTYVTQRAEVLGSAFYLATLLLLLARPLDARPRPWATWAAALAAFLLGFTAKPIVVTLPAALVAILVAAAPRAGEAGADRAPGGPGPAAPSWRGGWPVLAAVGLAAGALAAGLLGAIRGLPHVGFSVEGTGPWRYLLTQAQVLLVYLRLLAWPSGQSVDWAFPTSPGLGDPATLAATLAVLALVGGAAALLVRGRRTPGAAGAPARLAGLGIAWFFVLLAPTSSVIPLADNLVEHRVYLASFGAFLAVVAAVDALAARRGADRVAAGAWAVAVAALGVALLQRNAVWETREGLWRDALVKTPASARARLNLGSALDEQGRLDEAMAEYQAAWRLAPDRRQRAQALLNLGVAQISAGRLDQARAALLAARQDQPDGELILVNLGILAGMTGDLAEAEALARRLQQLSPRQPSAHVILGNLALEQGDWAGALDAFARAIALDRERGEAHYGRALAFRMLRRPAEECGALRDALAAVLRPQYRTTIEADVAARCR